MVCATYKTLFATMAVIALSSTDAGGIGVCYAPWFHDAVTEDVLKTDIIQIGKYFSSFRTFETRMSNLNAIDVAASAGVKIAAGVQMNDPASVDAEIQAVCDGYAKNPASVEVVWVGNENLQNNGFGTYSAEQLIGYIEKVKQCTNNGVPVGTVQRINEWNSAPGADKVAGACTKIGVNIYPFFTKGEQSAIEKLQAQWEQMTAKYDAGKIVLTETGWPTAGEEYMGNVPSVGTMQQYLNDFAQWSADKGQSYFFMMYDTTVSYTGAEYEKHFGVFGTDGSPKVTVPSGFASSTSTSMTVPVTTDGGDNTQQSEPTATPAPEYYVDVPEYHTRAPETPGQVTPAGETPAPEYYVDVPEYHTRSPETPVQETPAGETPAPEYYVDVPEYHTRSPETPVQETPAVETPAQETPVVETPAQETPAVETPAVETPVQDTPSVTPAPTTPSMTKSGTDCAM